MTPAQRKVLEGLGEYREDDLFLPDTMKSLVDKLSPLDPPLSPVDVQQWGSEHGWDDRYTGMLMGVAGFLVLPGARAYLARLPGGPA